MSEGLHPPFTGIPYHKEEDGSFFLWGGGFGVLFLGGGGLGFLFVGFFLGVWVWGIWKKVIFPRLVGSSLESFYFVTVPPLGRISVLRPPVY